LLTRIGHFLPRYLALVEMANFVQFLEQMGQTLDWYLELD
jgi:hypothetical protein